MMAWTLLSRIFHHMHTTAIRNITQTEPDRQARAATFCGFKVVTKRQTPMQMLVEVVKGFSRQSSALETLNWFPNGKNQ